MNKKNYTHERIFHSYQCRNYIKASKEIAQFYKEDSCEPSVISKKYKEALKIYREFLNELGIKMPLPDLKYDVKDKDTWKFSSIRINNCKKIINGIFVIQKQYAGSIVNPNWKGHK